MSQPSPSHIPATAVRVATLRRLALSVLFTIVTNSYQTTCTVSERTFNKRQHANARYRVDSSLSMHYDRSFPAKNWYVEKASFARSRVCRHCQSMQHAAFNDIRSHPNSFHCIYVDTVDTSNYTVDSNTKSSI